MMRDDLKREKEFEARRVSISKKRKKGDEDQIR